MTRKEAIEILKNLWTYLQTDIRQALEMAIKALEQEPKKTGHWVDYTQPNWETAYKCSECGSHSGCKQNYCPNCGAKMISDESYANDWIGYSR